MSDATTHAERLVDRLLARSTVLALKGENTNDMLDSRLLAEAAVALDALLEENARKTTQLEQERSLVTKRGQEIDRQMRRAEAAEALVETLRHKESSMDTMLRVTEAERDEERALVVSLTEQRDELAKRLESATASVEYRCIAHAATTVRDGDCTICDLEQMEEELGRELNAEIEGSVMNRVEAILDWWRDNECVPSLNVLLRLLHRAQVRMNEGREVPRV